MESKVQEEEEAAQVEAPVDHQQEDQDNSQNRPNRREVENDSQPDAQALAEDHRQKGRTDSAQPVFADVPSPIGKRVSIAWRASRSGSPVRRIGLG